MADDDQATFQERFTGHHDPQAQREGGLLQTVPQAVEAFSTSEGRAKFAATLRGYPTHFVEGLLDFFKTPGTAVQKGLTPDQEVEFGVNAALGTIGAEFKMPKGTATAFNQFHEQVTKPLAQNLISVPGANPEPPRIIIPLSPENVSPQFPPHGVPRSQLALTNEPHIDSVLNARTTKSVIDNAIVDRTHDVPYGAGGSVPLEKPVTYIDKNFPRSFSIDGRVFDPADPFIVHENTEQTVMGLLEQAGWDKPTAYKVAHFEFAEKAEGAWYKAHGIDQARAEAAYKPYLDAIQRKTPTNVPADLYKDPYPHDSPFAAQHEALSEPRPTPAEIDRAKQVIADWQAKGSPEPEPQVPPKVNPLQEAHELGVIGENAPENINLVDLARRDADTPAEAAFRAVPLSAAVTPETMKGRLGHAPGEYDARGKEWIDKIDAPEDARAAIEGMARQYDFFPEARGGTPSPASRAAVAEAAGIDPSEINSKYFAEHFDGDGKVRAVVQALRQTTKDVMYAGEKMRRDPSDENAAALMVAQERHKNVLEYTMGARAESGRSLAAWKDLLKETEHSRAAPKIAADEAAGKLPKGVRDVVDAVRDLESNLAKPKPPAKLGLEKLVEAAEQLGKLEFKQPKELKPGEVAPKPPELPPDVRELVRTANAVVNLMNGPKEAEAVDTVRPLRKIERDIEPGPKNALVGFNALVGQAERNVNDILKQKTGRPPKEALPPELQALVDKANFVTKRFGGIAKGEEAALLLARSGRTAAEQAELARQVEGLTPNQIARVLQRLRTEKRPGWMFWSVQQGLISGLITHTKYAVVNTAQTVFERIISPELGAIIGRARGEKTSLYAPLRAIPEFFNAVPDALAGAKQAFKTNARIPLESELRLAERGEKSPEAAGAQVPYGQSQGPDWGRVGRWFPQGTKNAEAIIGVPGRSANSIHTVFKILNERMAAGSRAYEKAELEGNKPGTQEFWDRYHYHLDNPTDDVLRANVEDGYSGTFMQHLGKQSENFARLVRNTPAKWLIFFTHIPLNMARAGVEYSPLAFLNTLGETKMGAAIKGELGPDAQNLAFAKIAIGTAIGGYFISRALAGKATGDYPTDPKERHRWQVEGIQPNSVQTADGQWMSLERLGPQVLPARIAANFADVIKHYDGSDNDAFMKATWATVLGTGRAVASDVGFETIRNIIDIMENPKEAARAAAYQLASYTMPISFLAQGASFNDPYMRVANDYISALKYRLPLLRETLPAKRDPVYGEPVANPGYHAIFRGSPVQQDFAKQELDRIGYFPTYPEKTIGGVKLTPEQFDKYQATAGPLVKAALNGLVRSPSWQAHNDNPEWQTTVAKQIVSQARAKARGAMQLDDHTLIEAARQRRLSQINGK